MQPRILRRGLVAAAVALTSLGTLTGVAPPAHAATWSVRDLTQPGITALAMAQEIAGPGVTVVSASFTGNNQQGGLFSGPGVADAVGVSDGVVLSSGKVADVVGPNDAGGKSTGFGNPGDTFLNTLVAPRTTRDAAVLEMTFVPVTTDLQINYVFASEEYREYVDSSFNDVFAFQVNGTNCATVATTSGTPEPVTINTINDHKNDQLYIDNPADGGTFDTQFDGFTQVLTCFATVTPGVNNTLRLAVADTTDSILDAAVFLESSGVTSTPKTKYTPLAQPLRAYDSRTPAGGATRVTGGTSVTIPMAGLHGVPADAVSVALNVTADGAEAPGFLTVYPGTDPLPTASNVNYRAGGADPNLVVAKLGTDGSIKVFTDKTTNVIVDVFGYFSTTATNGFIPVTPARLIDTRSGARPGAGQIVTFSVAGVAGVPAGAPAVVLNLTLDQPASPGWAAVYAAGAPVPATSNVNVGTGETRPNVVFAPVGSNGQVSVYLDTSAHVIADVFGYYSTASTAELFKPVKPKRIIDTRPGGVRVAAGTTLDVKVTDIAGVPSTATAVVLNVTATDAQGTGYLTVYPFNVPLPPSSNVNYVAGQSIPNVVVSGVSPDGRVKIFASADTHVIVDVAGWFG
jgi:hypothetical protein